MATSPPSETNGNADSVDKKTWPWWKCLLGIALLLTTAGVVAINEVSPQQFVLSAMAVVVILLTGLWICWQAAYRTKLLALSGVIVSMLAVAAAAGYVYVSNRYRIREVMEVPVTEFSNVQYPEDPAHWSTHYSNYNGRKLTLVRKDATHFDFILEPLHPFIARIEIRDMDVSLMTPNLPEWAKQDAGLQRIALTDRQWNRQQVSFEAASPHVTVTGGDGFEKRAARCCRSHAIGQSLDQLAPRRPRWIRHWNNRLETVPSQVSVGQSQ